VKREVIPAPLYAEEERKTSPFRGGGKGKLMVPEFLLNVGKGGGEEGGGEGNL